MARSRVKNSGCKRGTPKVRKMRKGSVIKKTRH